ncbi:MAG: hypothetical protein IPI49_08920 [Myxococcales bacterium]|nr:hypothetical protein [Myxococcales bacterium]
MGAACDSGGDCDNTLQCLRNVCIPRCDRASQCGDGFACRADGLCIEARGEAGNSCDSETACRAGLACKLDPSDADQDGLLQATCSEDRHGHAVGAECSSDSQCRNGTCALGRCVDLCGIDRDCPPTTTCTRIPRVEADGAAFRGCLPERGLISWEIPVAAPTADVLVPVPAHALSLSLAMTVDDDSQLVGASYLTSPPRDSNVSRVLFSRSADYYANPIRHRAGHGVSMLQIPSSSAARIEGGAYHLTLSSLRPNGEIGSATPRLKATVRVMPANATGSLPLHFHFVDFTDYPCSKTAFPGAGTLNAEIARREDFFQLYITDLREVLAGANVALAPPTYDDLPSKNARDNIAPEHVRALASKGIYSSGINVFFVRSLSPAGSRAIGPTPGPVGIKGTAASGIIISLEPLCYRTWKDVARITAHQLARYMGLFPNIDSAGRLDPIEDSDVTSDNLMFFSDQGGTALTPGQRAILSSSPAQQ